MSPVLSVPDPVKKNKFLHPRLVIYFFPNPPIKLTLRLQTGGGLIVATHLDQSNYQANQGSSVQPQHHVEKCPTHKMMAGAYNRVLAYSKISNR
jgi:hypothetical protein